MKQIRIVIADDHEVVRMGIKALIHQHEDLYVVGEAANGDDAIKQALLYRPDVVVMDIRMPGLSGIDACRQIVAQLPDTRVIMLTSYAENDLLVAAIRAGASNYVLKRIGSDELVKTIRAVASGEAKLDPALTEAMFHRVNRNDAIHEQTIFSGLSSQEMNVLVLIADGLTNREIAGHLFLGEGTVRNYVSSVLNKLHLANRAEAAGFAVKHNAKQHLIDV